MAPEGPVKGIATRPRKVPREHVSKTKRRPRRYFSGLSKTKRIQRVKEIETREVKHWKTPSAYKPFSTDKGVKTKTSKYMLKLQKLMAPREPEEYKTFEQKGEITGVPAHLLKECYNRGMAAWRTGHRPGATEQQWGYARVASLLVCGKTYYSADADLVRKAKEESPKAKEWWSKC
jgi:hypothetical protein